MVEFINYLLIFIVIFDLLFLFICLVFYILYLVDSKAIIDVCDYKYDYGSLKTYLNICDKYAIQPFLEYKEIYCRVYVDISVYHICIDKKLLILYPIDYVKYMYGFIKNSNNKYGSRVKGLWDD